MLLIMKGKIPGLVIVGLVCCSGSGCQSERTTDQSSGLSAPNSIADASKSPSESAPITWNDVASSYDRVQDYVCSYEKMEQAIAKGELQNIRFYFRKPLDVRMEWLDAHGNVDQTAVYREGFNDGKVLARESGWLGTLAGDLRLDPNESLALSDSRHPITEVGIGKIIDRGQHDAANPGVASYFVGEEKLDGRPAYKFEFIASTVEWVGGVVDARTALIWIDRELRLPVKLELYDAANALLEQHQFKNVRINQKLSEKMFTL